MSIINESRIYLYRTIIEIYGGQIVSTADSNLIASVVLAENDSLRSRAISIDNIAPTVQHLTKNVTDGFTSCFIFYSGYNIRICCISTNRKRYYMFESVFHKQ
jgi:hypothetical protein